MARNLRKVKDITTVAFGKEPEWKNHKQTSNYNSEMIGALTWYRNVASPADRKRWLIVWAKRRGDFKESDIKKLPDEYIITSSAVARMVEQGFNFKEKDITSVKDKISSLIKRFVVDGDKNKTKPKPKKSPRDIADEKLSPFYTMYDMYIDGTKKELDTLENTLNKSQLTELLKYYTIQLDDANENKEAYDKASIPDLKKKLGKIIKDIQSVQVIKTITKVRKKRVVTKNKQVQKLKYQTDFAEYGVVSINPENIIGANVVLTFNTKNRQLAMYISECGISVKGSTLKDFDGDESYAKTIRNPSKFLAQLTAVKKSQKLIDGVKAVKKTLTGRINKDTIILKAW